MGDSSFPLGGRDRVFFNTAKDVADLSDHRYKLGCVIVDKHRIISSGHNSKTKTHRVQAELDTKFFNCQCQGPVHAEVDAMLPLIKRRVDLTNATLYVYRQDKAGHIAMARPCPRCMSLIRKYGIRRIKYTTADGYAMERILQGDYND